MTEPKYLFFPMNTNRDLQCQRLYQALLRYKQAVRDSGGAITAVPLTDLYTMILDINRKGDEPLPAFAAQLVIEAAVQE